MKRISKKDLVTMKAAMAFVKENGENGSKCEHCPMGSRNNRLKMPCGGFIRFLGGEDIYDEAVLYGYFSQHDAIRYMILKAKQINRRIKI